jgi:DNA-binding cell septation regulator SpoVG
LTLQYRRFLRGNGGFFIDMPSRKGPAQMKGGKEKNSEEHKEIQKHKTF